jgi:hypothetical protein
MDMTCTQTHPHSPRPTNGFAITALVSSLVLAPLGIVFGHIALNRITVLMATPSPPMTRLGPS